MFRPDTVEKLATYAEKAGRLAAEVIRAQPAVAEELAPDLFNLVAEAFCYATALPGTPAALRDSRSYAEFMLAWENVLYSMESDKSR